MLRLIGRAYQDYQQSADQCDKVFETYIRIRLYSEGERLLLSVCNDGLVIPVEMREEIFKPFIQYKTGTLRSVPGTGIGLALARSLAELHEGTLCMEDSMENNCFLLSLPLKHEQTVAMEHKESVTGGEPSEESGAGTALEQHRYTLWWWKTVWKCRHLL